MNKIIIAIVVVIVVVAGAFFVFGNSSSSKLSPTISPTETQPQEVTPTEVIVEEDVMMKEKNTATLSAQGFSPASLTIKTGGEVTWLNKSGATANVSSDPHPTHTNYQPLNLGQFKDGESLSLVFDKKGTYSYHNHLIPTQKGTIIVE